ncbi:MAG: DegT/DnrJ/EryC1/StrS family aminotransferase [Planctomyces sp.]|nr:DegT/DnrJ/EryC1/StrS family aminotransferase [Planctomyces sp.]
MQVKLNDLSRSSEELTAKIQAAVIGVVDSGWYVHGHQHERFEHEFARWCGLEHAIGVASGTDAIELALRALGCGPGDRVATVANAGGYATLAALAVGCFPVFVDIDQRLNMCPDDLARVLRSCPEIKVVVVTHLYGQLAQIDAIQNVVRTAGIKLVEDCAQAHGASLNGRLAGSFSDAGCFSFYPTKNLGGMGDGGAVVTADVGVADRLRRLRQYGWGRRYHVELSGGRNSRLDEIQAAILRIKLPHVHRWNTERRRIAERYHEAASGTNLLFPSRGGAEDYVAHLCVARHPDRDTFRDRLLQRGIATDIHFPILDVQHASLNLQQRSLPMAEQACREIVTLPCFPGMQPDEVDYVCEAIRECGV